jgi:hypothetical protein
MNFSRLSACLRQTQKTNFTTVHSRTAHRASPRPPFYPGSTHRERKEVQYSTQLTAGATHDGIA